MYVTHRDLQTQESRLVREPDRPEDGPSLLRSLLLVKSAQAFPIANRKSKIAKPHDRHATASRQRPDHAAQEGRQLGAAIVAVADAVRDRLLRHRADGDGVVALRL